ncbi:MAG TPA: hypothetical protein VEZ90_11735 [Blastocatellia bacterium]|nr:hypothetical protein [Blastocatellia bacterium]
MLSSNVRLLVALAVAVTALAGCLANASCETKPVVAASNQERSPRSRVLIDDNWRFIKGDPPNCMTSLLYDVRPKGSDGSASTLGTQTAVPKPATVKSWILPTGGAFLEDASKAARRPEGNLGDGVAYVAENFDDSTWQKVDLPHDYAIEGPFSASGGGGMGRLPSDGVVWYRKHLSIPASDRGKSIFLDIDGAMSYSEVWLNRHFVGGWPYGYASFRLNLTPYAKPGAQNVLAIRLDSPPDSSRWYPGGGLYRNVWLVETAPVHVAQWGTYITTPEVSGKAATVSLKVALDDDSMQDASVSVGTQLFVNR